MAREGRKRKREVCGVHCCDWGASGSFHSPIPFPQSFLSRCAATTRLLTGNAAAVYIFLQSLVYMDLSLLPSRLQLLHPKPGAATSSPAPYPGRLLSSALSWARLCRVQ